MANVLLLSGWIMEGSYSEALRELEGVKGKRDVGLATFAAMIVAHKLCKIVDGE